MWLGTDDDPEPPECDVDNAELAKVLTSPRKRARSAISISLNGLTSAFFIFVAISAVPFAYVSV